MNDSKFINLIFIVIETIKSSDHEKSNNIINIFYTQNVSFFQYSNLLR